MKYTSLTILLLSIYAFADAGDADRLAGGVFGIIGLIVGLCAITAGITLIAGIGMKLWQGCCWLWEHSTNIGKIVLFGIPMLIGFTSVFYWLIWCVAPWIYDNSELVGSILLGVGGVSLVVLYCGLVKIGWDDYGNKRKGPISTIARVIVSIPVIPVIIVCWFIKNLIGKLFITRYNWTNLFNIWRYSE